MNRKKTTTTAIILIAIIAVTAGAVFLISHSAKNKNAAPTRLQKMRKAQKLSQSQLATLSGVSLRMIQLYEQRQNDINNASAQTITSLARALNCNFYEIMEIDLEE